MEQEMRLLKQRCNLVGGTLLVYKIIMTVTVVAFMIIAAVAAVVLLVMGEAFQSLTNNGLPLEAQEILTEKIADAVTASMGWGYLLAITIGFLILLLWKKPAYFKNVLFVRNKRMGIGVFAFLLCLCMAIQVATQLLALASEGIYGMLGFSLQGLVENSGVAVDSWVMLAYVGILGPIAEELLFRGLLLRSLEPHGKGIALFVSAVLFGFFHGTPVQTPFAIAMGLLLGYVTLEYNIGWAIVIHIFNNLILGDTLPRLLVLLPNIQPETVMWILMAAAALVVAILALLRRKQFMHALSGYETSNEQCRAVVQSPCVILVVVMSLFDMVTVMVALLFAQ